MSHHFALFRVLFGCYLTVHFGSLLPYATELFSNNGILPDASLNPTGAISPTWITPFIANALVLLSTVLSLLFTFGKWRRPVAIALWLVATLLLLRNNLTANPGLPYINLALVLSAFVPSGERLFKATPGWEIPRSVLFIGGFLLALGYTFSGYTKLYSASWIDGSALRHVLENPLARPGFVRSFLLQLPDRVLQVATWFALAAELLFLPLYYIRRIRPWIWTTLLFMHLGLILCVDFADLSLGMIMIHLFLFDPRWICAPGAKEGAPVQVGFDGSCLMCSGFMNWLATTDTGHRFTFYAQEHGSSSSTIMVHYKDRILTKSDAIAFLLAQQGGLFRLLAIAGQVLPRSLRDFVYDSVARHRHKLVKKTACSLPSPQLRSRLSAAPGKGAQRVGRLWLPLLLLSLSSCTFVESPNLEHERPAFEIVPDKEAIREGDVLAFSSSKAKGFNDLFRGRIQKVPYLLFDYGHLAIVVQKENELRLLQMALGQTANYSSDLSYLKDKESTIFRPTISPNPGALRSFAKAAVGKITYDKLAILGLANDRVRGGKIPSRLTCVTLVEAALHSSGVPIDVRHWWLPLDVITPSQLVNSTLRETKSPHSR